MNRRKLLGSIAALSVPALVASPAITQPRPKRFKMLLNTSVSGPQAWFYLAEDKGYFAQEGIEITFSPGGGAYTAAPRMNGSDFDFGYGDINSLIEVAATNQGTAPVGIYAMFNASPSTVAVSAAGPIRVPKDLEGKVIIGHSSDVALRTFGAFCTSTGIDRSKVTIGQMGGGFRSMAEAMIESSSIHGVFGYVSTIASAMAEGGVDRNNRLRHFQFAQFSPDLYGSVIMASRRMIEQDPAAVSGVVRAINRAVIETIRDPEAAIASVMRRAHHADRKAEILRLKTTLAIEMAHADGKRIGMGAVDQARLTRSIALIASTNGLLRTPAFSEIFTPQFLPALTQRIRP